MIKSPDHLNKKQAESGFSLIELLIAMAIASILMTAVVSVFYYLNRSMSGENTRVALQQSVRAAVNVMASDLKEVGLDPHTKKRFSIERATGSEIRFSSDLNMDGTLDDNEMFTYAFSGSNLNMTIGRAGAPEPLLSNVESLSFRYFNDRDTEIGAGAGEVSDRDEIRSVEITLSARENYWGGSGSETRSYTTLVRCRNLNRL